MIGLPAFILSLSVALHNGGTHKRAVLRDF